MQGEFKKRDNYSKATTAIPELKDKSRIRDAIITSIYSMDAPNAFP